MGVELSTFDVGAKFPDSNKSRSSPWTTGYPWKRAVSSGCGDLLWGVLGVHGSFKGFGFSDLCVPYVGTN